MRVLVTGAGTWTGGRLIQRLEVDPGVSLFGVDDVPPRLQFASPYTQMALDDLDDAEVITEFDPEVVIHLGTLDRPAGRNGGRADVVVGSQALFGALARTPSLRHLIVKSDGAVYGAGPRSPSVVDESSSPGGSRSRRRRHLADLEAAAADLSRRRPGCAITVMRYAPIIGPNVSNPLSRYLVLPVVPTQFGFDPRLQFIYEEDAVGALIHAMAARPEGTFNIAAAGQLYLSRVLRLGRRIQQPVPKRTFAAMQRALGAAGASLPSDLRALLRFGRVLDTSAMEKAGFSPHLTCRQSVLALYRRVAPQLVGGEAQGHG